MTTDEIENFSKEVKVIISGWFKNEGFKERKITDTPTENLQVVNRQYVNMYSSVASLPKSSIIGQQVFVTELGYPAYKHQNGRWVNGVGSIIS